MVFSNKCWSRRDFFKAVGTATNTLHRMKKSEIIGVRGPFGNWFNMNFEKPLLIGGGTGIAPLFFLSRKMIEKSDDHC